MDAFLGNVFKQYVSLRLKSEEDTLQKQYLLEDDIADLRQVLFDAMYIPKIPEETEGLLGKAARVLIQNKHTHVNELPKTLKQLLYKERARQEVLLYLEFLSEYLHCELRHFFFN